MFLKKGIKIGLLVTVLMFVTGCGNSTEGNSKVLEKGEIYLGKNATHEIIEVDSNTSWTIKSDKKDDTNYTIVSVEETGEEIHGYSVVKLTAKESIGDIDSSFAKKESREFIITKDEESVYFRSVAEGNKEEIKQDLDESDDPDQHVMDIANFVFYKQ